MVRRSTRAASTDDDARGASRGAARMADAATRAGASASASATRAARRDARERATAGALRCEFRVMRLRAPAYEHAGAREGRAIDDG